MFKFDKFEWIETYLIKFEFPNGYFIKIVKLGLFLNKISQNCSVKFNLSFEQIFEFFHMFD